MFNLHKISRRTYTLLGIGVCIVILATVTVLSNTNFKYQDQTNYADRLKESQEQQSQYQQLLASLNINAQGSQAALQKIATQDVVKEDVEQSLQTNQKITIPTIDDKALAITPRGDKAAVVNYMTNAVALIKDYNDKTGLANDSVYTDGQDSTVVANAIADTKETAAKLQSMPVPADAVGFHKAELVALNQYASFLQTAQSYASANTNTAVQPRGDAAAEPWPSVYRDYSIINDRAIALKSEYGKLNATYALNDEPTIMALLESNITRPQPSTQLSDLFIKHANAQLGVNFTTITANIPELALEGVKQGLLKAFSKFFINAIDKLVAKIDKYFTITSQLYYSQELGKLYTNEYWKKFNVSIADQSILQNFIPDYFCTPTNASQLKDIFTAKSKQLLKYDISTITYDSPNFYDALAELGTAAQTNPEQYWTDYYSSLAGQSQTAAADAATKEVTGSGVKAGRDLISGEIDKTLSKVLDVQQSSIDSAVNLGASNADNIVSTFVSSIFEQLTTKFVFTAVSSGTQGGGLAVVGESPVCFSTAKYKPVIAGTPDAQDAVDTQNANIAACKGTLQAAASLPANDTVGRNSSIVQDCISLFNQTGNAIPTASTSTTQ